MATNVATIQTAGYRKKAERKEPTLPALGGAMVIESD
jgi:hypothetical protein